VRKKYFAGALVGVLALALAAVAIASPQFKQTVRLKYTTQKTKAATGLRANLFARDPGAQPPGNQKGVSFVTITFRGARTDTTAGRRCRLPKAQAAQCPRSTRIGTGSAVGRPITKTNPPNVGGDVRYTVNAYLKRGGVYLVVAGALGPFILDAPLSRRGKLSVNVKRDVSDQPAPTQLGLKAVLTDFKLTLRKVTRRSGRRRKALLRTPRRCPRSRRFRITTKFVYDDGSRLTKTNRPRCRRPRR
jgi:hypothetical protein